MSPEDSNVEFSDIPGEWRRPKDFSLGPNQEMLILSEIIKRETERERKHKSCDSGIHF
jgi:hypothetical protein